MKKFNKISIITVLAIALVVGFTPPIPAHAATSPSLGAADTFSVLAQTAITGIATIVGNVEMNNVAASISALMPTNVTGGLIYSSNGSTTVGGGATSLLDSAVQANTLTAFGALDAVANADANCIKPSTGLPGIDTSGTELGGLSLAPGLYCSAGTFNLTGNLALTGTTGTWVFKTVTGITANVDSSVTGGDPCNVWWRVGSAATINSTSFIGTIIANTGVWFGTGVTLNGRALAKGGDVTFAGTDSISVPICTAPTLQGTLHVTKTVVNTGGGTKVPGDFTMNIHAFNSSQDTSFLGDAGGTSTTLDVGAYSVTETGPTGYTSSGNCSGTITDGITSDCTITNTYRRQSSGGSIARVVVPVFQPTITILSTPVVVPVIPMLPTTGFPPQESDTWYESLLNNILNLFR